MVDPMHNAVRRDPRMNWICQSTMRHRELRGLTAAGRKSRGLLNVGPHRATKMRGSKNSNYKRSNRLSLRRYR